MALIDERGIRIVADGFVGTNEVRLDANEEWLYVVKSNARRISRQHMVGFRESPLFSEWPAILGPFFTAMPVVDHCECVEHT